MPSKACTSTLTGGASPRRVATAVVLATFALGTVSFARNYRGQADWKAVGRFLNAKVRAGDPVVLYATDGALPLEYYFPRSNPVFQLPEPDKRRPHTEIVMTAADGVRAREALAAARDAGRLWLLEKNGLPADSALVMLRRYDDDSLAVGEALRFGRTRVRAVLVTRRDQASR